MALNRDQIIESVQNQNGFTKTRSLEIVKILIEIIKSKLESGEDLMVTGFGKFYVKEKKGCRWRNPLTGNFEMLPPKRLVTFKCSKKLRDRINSK
jgi:integration host factor subunit alpha